jgi:porphobilinogen synthase
LKRSRSVDTVPFADMPYPIDRPRRLRKTETLRALVRETSLSPGDFMLPLFAVPGRGVKKPISSMPGVSQLSVDLLVEEARSAFKLGVRSVILFGIPDTKDSEGTGAWDDNGPVCAAFKALKDAVPELLLVADVCLCEYTDHGHCGPLERDARGHVAVANDRTLPLLARAAVAYAKAGADVIAPSDMMDGRVAALRNGLDEAGFHDTPILSYAVKYASGFYGPFREAAQSAPKSGDRRGYQMDPANVREARREALLDAAEGADLLMVKPALAYLDVISEVKRLVNLPIAAYNVSGEYAMLKAAAQNGWIEEKRVCLEILTGIKRAGADVILTYSAMDAARWLAE